VPIEVRTKSSRGFTPINADRQDLYHPGERRGPVQRSNDLSVFIQVYRLLSAVLLAATLVACSPADPSVPHVRAFDEPRALQPFSLVDHRGERFNEARLRGRWTLVTFGYTSCPDVCPTMLVNLVELRRSLAAEWHGVAPQFIFVTVDPKRDTAELLARFVPAFDSAFLGVTGTQESLDNLHKDFGGAHRRNKPHHGTDHYHYMVDHSVLLYLVDPAGNLVAQFAPPFDPAAVAGRVVRMAQGEPARVGMVAR
jgi:protein SCO1/2